MAWTDTKGVGDLLREFENRYEWVGEMGCVDWDAVNADVMKNALHAMWNDWRDVVRPTLDRELKVAEGGDDATA
jgi:hypothetical protein